MIRDLPKDLALVILITISCILFVLIPPLNETPMRVVLGILLVLLMPGYSLIAAIFPRRDDLDWIERIALSFGLSIAVVPLIGLALNYTPYGIRLVPLLVGLSLFTILLALVAYVRRGLVLGGAVCGRGMGGVVWWRRQERQRGRRQGRWTGVSGSGVIVAVAHDEFRGWGFRACGSLWGGGGV